MRVVLNNRFRLTKAQIKPAAQVCVRAFQGKGYARSLLRAMLGRIDNERLPCYLETQNQSNLPIYRHYGFKVIKDVIIPGTKLHHWLMLREKSP